MKNVPGRILAFDASTGARKWRFNTIPQKGEVGYETWDNGSAEYTGNAGAWAPLTLDESRGYLYLPVEAPTGDYYGGHRPGDESSTATRSCASTSSTGKRRVVLPDRAPRHLGPRQSPPRRCSRDITSTAARSMLVVQLTKQAFAYVFDRVTGKPVWPIAEQQVPQSRRARRAHVGDAADPVQAARRSIARA